MIELQRPAKLRFGPFNKSEDEQRAFFHAALERAQEAETKAGTIERCFAVAGFLFNVKFAGNVLAQWFTPALAHLEVPLTSRPDAGFGFAQILPGSPHSAKHGRDDTAALFSWLLHQPRRHLDHGEPAVQERVFVG